MSDNERTDIVETDRESAAPEAEADAVVKTPGAGRGLARAALLLGLVAVLGTAALAWFGWQAREQISEQLASAKQSANNAGETVKRSASAQQALDQSLQKNRALIETVQQSLSKLDTATQAAQRRAEAAEQAADAKHKALRGEIHQLREQIAALGGAPSSGWYRDTARNLLEIGYQRLNLARDINGAASALQSADRALAAAQRPALDNVRQAIQAEIKQVQAVPKVDTAALSKDLDSLAVEVQKLSARPPKAVARHLAPSASEATPSTGEHAPSAWEKLYGDVLHGLRSLVVIRRTSVPAEPLPPPEQGPAMAEYFSLSLEVAQVALMRGDAERYQNALGRAAGHLAALGHTHALPNTLAERLEALSSADIAPPLPTLGKALDLLNEPPSEDAMGAAL